MRYFSTGNPKADKILNSLESSSDEHQIVDTPESLQIWLSGVLSRIFELPEPYHTQMHVTQFQIGDQHFTCRPERVKDISRELVKLLQKKLGQFKHEEY